ncbi:MAG: hypothetical protein WAM30_21045 [Candidatus Dormiibacterota bacterium]
MTQLARFIIHRLLDRRPASNEEPHWHFDRERGSWVEPHMEHRAA